MWITTVVGLIITLANLSTAFVAYNCDSDGLNMTALSLISTPECKQEPNMTSFTSAKIVVTQVATQYEIEYFRCSVESLNVVGRCGSLYDTFVDTAIFSDVHRVSLDECRDMISRNTYRIRGANNIVDVALDSDVKKVGVMTRGSFDGNSCTPGANFYRKGVKYDRPVVSTEFTIIRATGKATVDAETNKIHFPSGVQCTFSEESCFTADLGYAFWKIPTPGCNGNDELSVIYSGASTVASTKRKNGDLTQYIQVTHGGYDFQIQLHEKTLSVCGFRSFHTEHPNLFVTILPDGVESIGHLRASTSNDVSLLNYVNSKLVFSIRHVKQEVDRLYRVLAHDRCKSHNRITKNMLTLAVISPIEFAYAYGGQGYTATRRGEVTYVAKCPAVSVELDETSVGCYNELPVKYNNVSMFMSARNRILLPIGTPVKCLPDILPKFMLGDNWYVKTDHGLIKTSRPQIITPDAISYEFEEIKSLTSGGLYTREMIEKYQKALITPMVNEVLSVRVSDAVSGTGELPDGYSFISGFKMVDYDKLRKKAMSWTTKADQAMWQWGGRFSFVILLFALWKAFIYILGTVINFCALRKDLSICCAIPLAMMDTLTHLALSGKILKEKFRKDNTRNEDIEMGITRPNQAGREVRVICE